MSYQVRAMTPNLSAILYNAAVIVAVWLGTGLSLVGRQTKVPAQLVTSFSAGIFLSMALIHMIPESFEILGEAAGRWVVGGFLFFYALERFVMIHPCEEHACDYHKVGVAAFVGLSVHSLMNGVALGSSILLPGLGFGVFLGTFFHKLPESFSLTNLLVAGPERKSWLPYIIMFSLMVPMGSGLAILGLAPLGKTLIGVLIASSAGMFLQIATGDLLSGAHQPGKRRFDTLVGLILGTALIVFTQHIGHGH